jgi:hypothetical protein
MNQKWHQAIELNIEEFLQYAPEDNEMLKIEAFVSK